MQVRVLLLYSREYRRGKGGEFFALLTGFAFAPALEDINAVTTPGGIVHGSISEYYLMYRQGRVFREAEICLRNQERCPFLGYLAGPDRQR